MAVFDFDRTLIHQESLAMFLRLVAGNRRYATAVLAAGLAAAVAPAGQRRQVFRQQILRRTLAGKTLEDCRLAAGRLFSRLTWIPHTVQALHHHRQQGHRVLLATGSLSLYMPVLLELGGIPVDGLLATEIEVREGTVTGAMLTPSCTWQEKERRVRGWLSETFGGEPVESWGYGNLPPDQAMLALTDHPTVIPV